MYQKETRSIRSQFMRQLQECQDDVLRMGALVEHSCWLAHKALIERDLSAVDELTRQDEQVDVYYRQIEVNCIRMLALQSPVASDLRLIGTLMQMVRDLERIGDYAEELGEVALKLLPYPPLPYIQDLDQMSTVCRSMLAMSLSALTDLDAESGRLMNITDDEVDACYARVYENLAQSTVQGSVEPLLLVTLAIRALERMADHATNIGKRISYIVTGQR
ncbi:MAG: phosphate signaling complex protein PhoU [Thermosynechococcaceae cyanobacterium MS004]|nr:phosphate signaling complex protein PhoU [Thermosynechococcaceae cyanobacterium MS004]